MQPTNLSPSQIAAFVTPAHILVATDLTDGDFLVPHVVGQAKASGARVTLVHAILPANAFPMESGYAPYPTRRYLTGRPGWHCRGSLARSSVREFPAIFISRMALREM